MRRPRAEEVALVLLLLASTVESFVDHEYDELGLQTLQQQNIEQIGGYSQDWRRRDKLYLDEEAEEAERAGQKANNEQDTISLYLDEVEPDEADIADQKENNEQDPISLYLDDAESGEVEQQDSQKEDTEQTDEYAQDISEKEPVYVDTMTSGELSEDDEQLEGEAEQQVKEEEEDLDKHDNGLDLGEHIADQDDGEPVDPQVDYTQDWETNGENYIDQNGLENEKFNQETEQLSDAGSGETGQQMVQQGESEPELDPELAEVQQDVIESGEHEQTNAGYEEVFQETVGEDGDYLEQDSIDVESGQVQQGVEELADTEIEPEYEMDQERGGEEEAALADAAVEYVQSGEQEINQEGISQDEYEQEYVPIISDETLLAESDEEGLQRVERAEPQGRPQRSNITSQDSKLNEVDQSESEEEAVGSQSNEEGFGSVKTGLRWVAPWKAWPVYPGEQRTDSVSDLPLGMRPLGKVPDGSGQAQTGQDGGGQVGAAQGGAEQVRAGQVGDGQVGNGQVGAGQVGTGQVGTGQFGTGQVGDGQVGNGQVGNGQVGNGQVGNGQVGAGQVGTGQVGVGQIGAGQDGTGQVEAGQVGTGQIGTGQVGAGQEQPGSRGVGLVGAGPRTPAPPRPSQMSPDGRPGGGPGPAPVDVFHPERTRDFHPFEWRLCAAASERTVDNAALSPVGARLVLGVLGEAASGGAAAELRRALGLPNDSRRARRIYRRLIAALKQKQDGYLMDMGNRVYLDQHYEPLPDIAQVYSSIFDTDIQKVDFETPKVARNEINSWVSNKTHGRISMLLTNDQLLTNAVTMILNVIYFKGKWLYPFPKNDTIPDLFYTKANETVKAEFMRQTGDFYYLESERLDAKMLRLPYQGKKYSMFIILPRNPKNFNQVLRSLHPRVVREQILKMEKMEIDVKIPKIKMDCTIQMKEILQAIGIVRIFNVSSEINLTQNKTNLQISQIFQKVSLEVNEEGTVAAMATGSGLSNTFGGRLEFKATHPFLFFVEEERTGTVLFVGKVTDPSKTESVIDMEENGRLKRRTLWSYFPVHKSSRKSNSDSESDSGSHSGSDSDSDSGSRSDENLVYTRPHPRNGVIPVHFPTYYYANPYQRYPYRSYIKLPERK